MSTPTPEQSEIVISDSCATFAGPDAINLIRAVYLKAALEMYSETGMLMTRGATPEVLLRIAEEYTGKKYTGEDKYRKAAEAVGVWIETMKAALPVTDKRSRK